MSLETLLPSTETSLQVTTQLSFDDLLERLVHNFGERTDCYALAEEIARNEIRDETEREAYIGRSMVRELVLV